MKKPRLQLKELDGLNRREVEELLDNRDTRYIGAGGSRVVWQVSPRWVLKFSKTNPYQNEQEVELARNPQIAALFPEVREHAPDYRWVLSELARDVTRDEWERVRYTLSNVRRAGEQSPLAELLLKSYDAGLADRDLWYKLHWGVAADGRFVLLDAGIGETSMRKRWYEACVYAA